MRAFLSDSGAAEHSKRVRRNEVDAFLFAIWVRF